MNAVDDFKRTPLSLNEETDDGGEELMALSLKHGANVSAVDEDGKAALQLAVRNGSDAAAAMLREAMK